MKLTQISINVNSEANHCPILLDLCYSCQVSNKKLLPQETEGEPVITFETYMLLKPMKSKIPIF